MLDDTLLDDPERLHGADRSGLLRAAASAGAQVRATADAAAEAGMDSLAGSTPRAFVQICRPDSVTGASALVGALLGPRCPFPVVTAPAAPAWVGALDVVFAHTDDPGDVELAESIHLAGRRGASVVVTAPADGPVAAAAAGSAMLLPARVPVPPGFGLPRAVTAALAVVRALGLLTTVDLDRLADALDGEAERDHPGAESFVNPAKTLAMRLAGRIPLLWGTDPVATEVARHGARVFAAHAGLVCDAADLRAAAARPALRAAALQAISGQDIFADPDFDEPSVQVRLLLLAVASDEQAQRQRHAAEATFEGADVLAMPEELPADDLTNDPVQSRLTAAMVLALRLEMAALYLGLASGALGGPGTLAPSRV